jgi:flagellin-like protein
MKMIWKKREDAVSPVIATILMVAITVVLAAVLYVMVIGFGGGGGSTPAGSWTEVGATTSTTAKLTFGAFTTEVQPIDIKIFVTANGTAAGSITFSANTNPTMTWTGGPGTVTYFDYNPAGGLINSGDYLTLSGLTSGFQYSVEVFHSPTEATVAMTGDSGSWTQP